MPVCRSSIRGASGRGFERIFAGGVSAAPEGGNQPITDEVITMRPSPYGSMAGNALHSKLMRTEEITGKLLRSICSRLMWVEEEGHTP